MSSVRTADAAGMPGAETPPRRGRSTRTIQTPRVRVSAGSQPRRLQPLTARSAPRLRTYHPQYEHTTRIVHRIPL